MGIHASADGYAQIDREEHRRQIYAFQTNPPRRANQSGGHKGSENAKAVQDDERYGEPKSDALLRWGGLHA